MVRRNRDLANAIHRQNEQCLVASIIENPLERFGPKVRSALSYAPEFWETENVNLAAVVIRRLLNENHLPTLDAVRYGLLSVDDPAHVISMIELYCSLNDTLPMSCLESLADELLVKYRGLLVTRIVGDAWQQMRTQPENAKEKLRRCLRSGWNHAMGAPLPQTAKDF